MPDKEQTARKTVKLPQSLWERIADYRFDERIASETEAVRRIVEAGLRFLKRGAGKKGRRG